MRGMGVPSQVVGSTYILNHMCGRFTLDPTTKFYERFHVSNRLEKITARYNIAPAQEVPVVIRQSPNRMMMMRWGLIPHWAKEEQTRYNMINAKAETLTERPAYRGLLESKRCIIPASGFYEWQDTGEHGKQPYYIHADTGDYLPFAGLYDIWKNPEGEDIYSCTIITTQPTVDLKPIHNRMPVILEPDAEDVWLDPEVTDQHVLLPLLHPYTVRTLEIYKVSKAVNRAGSDSPEFIKKA
jgi:putative SOS response-associated peptidase YedK